MEALIRFVCAWLVCSTAFGATYYVRTNGNDSNPGTTGSPFLTVTKGVSVATSPGDTLIVGNGNYLERVSLPASGTTNNPITIRAENRRQAHIGGITSSRKFIIIDGFEFTSQGSFSGLVPTFEGMIQLTSSVENCYILNNWMHDSNTNVNNKALFLNVLNNVANDEAQIGTSTGWLICSNNTLSNITGNAFSFYGHDHLFISNYFDMGNQNDMFRGFGVRHRIIGNTMTNNNDPGGTGNHPDFYQTFPDQDYGVSGGTNWPVTITNIWLEGNLVINSISAICQLENNQPRTDVSTGLQTNTVGNVRDINWVNNVFVNCGAATIDTPDTRWYFNTFIHAATNVNNSMPLVFTATEKGTPTNAVIKNNIFFECGPNPANTSFGWYDAEGRTNAIGGPPYVNQPNSPPIPYYQNVDMRFTWDVDYNLVVGSSNGSKRTSTNMIGPNGATTYYRYFVEPHGFNGVDPKLDNWQANAFGLLNTSPLLDAGLAIAGINQDYLGSIRPAGPAPDIGAVEGAFTPPSSPPNSPSGLSATASNCSTINLLWTDNGTDETAYEVQRSPDGVSFSTLASIGANSFAYSDATVSASTIYYYRVRCSNAAGNSGFSGTANATTPSCSVPSAGNTFRIRVKYP